MALPPTFPDLTALDLFVSVVRLGSVSKAATAHGVTQPSASQRMRTLERQLGLKLLDRSPSGSVPTPDGSLVAGWAEDILRSSDQLASGVAALKATATGLLRISASFTLAEYLLPAWLEQFLRNRPEDAVSLDVANSSAVIERVSSGRFDLGFIESPDLATDFETQVVGTDELLVVVSPTHPWTRRPNVPVDEVAMTPMILREEGSGTRDALGVALAAHGLAPPLSALDLGSTAAVRGAVISGNAPTVISRLAVGADVDAGSLVAITVPDFVVHRRLRAIWPKHAELSPLARALLRQLPNLEQLVSPS